MEDEQLSAFKVDYAASNRSRCKTCFTEITMGKIRMGPMVQLQTADIKVPQWHHFTCFEKKWLPKHRNDLRAMSQVSGFDRLKFEDQQHIRALVTEGDSSKVVAVSKDDRARKVQEARIWKMVDRIKDVPMALKKEVLMKNRQPYSGPVHGGTAKVNERLADMFVFGALPRCPECGGSLVCNRGKYQCTGMATDFARCEWNADDVDRLPWGMPDDIEDEVLLSIRAPDKRIKKRWWQEEEGRDEAAAAGEGGEKQEKDRQGAVGDGAAPGPRSCFDGKVITFAGKLAKTVKVLQKVVQENGGTYAGTVNLVVAAGSGDFGANLPKKIKDADERRIPVVREEFLEKSIAAGRPLPEAEFCELNQPRGLPRRSQPLKRKAEEQSVPAADRSKIQRVNAYVLYPIAKPALMMQLVVKGRGAVDPESGLVDRAHVLDERGDLYNVVMNIADVTTGKNSYYNLQLLEKDGGGRWWVFRKWGRMGTPIGGNKLEKAYSLNEAKRIFAATFFEKSGNEWCDKANRYIKRPRKFQVIELDYSAGDADSKLGAVVSTSGYSGQLPLSTQKLMALIFDIKMMQDTLLSLEIDTDKMPLGKLARATILEGYKSLTELAKLIEVEPRPANFRTLIVSETNRFYSIIPHVFGEDGTRSLLDSKERVEEKCEMMKALEEMEVATSLMRGDQPVKIGEHPIDTKYNSLKCGLMEVPRDAPEFQMVEAYLANTHAATHQNYRLKLVDLWAVRKDGEEDRFTQWAVDPNRMLLWHGSRLTNWAGILSQGLRIAPPEAPATGYMFGKGLYFANMSTKSANYCFTTSENNTGLMVLCETALGRTYNLGRAEYMDKPPKGYESTWGQGRTTPDPSKTISWEGMAVPTGPGVASGHKTQLLYDEFIVYNLAQSRIRFLLRLEFVYNRKAGTFF